MLIENSFKTWQNKNNFRRENKSNKHSKIKTVCKASRPHLTLFFHKHWRTQTHWLQPHSTATSVSQLHNFAIFSFKERIRHVDSQSKKNEMRDYSLSVIASIESEICSLRFPHKNDCYLGRAEKWPSDFWCIWHDRNVCLLVDIPFSTVNRSSCYSSLSNALSISFIQSAQSQTIAFISYLYIGFFLEYEFLDNNSHTKYDSIFRV